MTLPTTKLLSAARSARRALADRATPFIFNEWYVAAFADEVGRHLLKRKILGRNVLLFRTEAGLPVILDDRCAHRSFPLSAGRLQGDTLVCGYHGFRYNAAGDCIEVPSQPSCPKGMGVRRYPVLEAGPLLWVWMGDSEQPPAPPAMQQSWLSSSEWARSQGYFSLRANYVNLHENLMDLTHLSYLHANTFGTADYARAPYEAQLTEGHYAVTRRVMPTRLPPVWAEPTGLLTDLSARIATSEFLSPAMHMVTADFYDTQLPESERRIFQIRTAHLPTPESLDSTHYFIVHGREFALDQPQVTEFMHAQLFAAFQEDVTGLQAQEQVLAAAGDDLYEMSVASDGAAVAMRRYLKNRADREGLRD